MVLTFNVMKKILFISLLLLLLAGCDTFHGCGPVVKYGYPEISGKNILYPVYFLGDDGNEHKVFISPTDYGRAKVMLDYGYDDYLIVCIE